jgi:hypothetical protein
MGVFKLSQIVKIELCKMAVVGMIWINPIIEVNYGSMNDLTKGN